MLVSYPTSIKLETLFPSWVRVSLLKFPSESTHPCSLYLLMGSSTVPTQTIFSWTLPRSFSSPHPLHIPWSSFLADSTTTQPTPPCPSPIPQFSSSFRRRLPIFPCLYQGAHGSIMKNEAVSFQFFNHLFVPSFIMGGWILNY
jgi:hypothetical protein